MNNSEILDMIKDVSRKLKINEKKSRSMVNKENYLNETSFTETLGEATKEETALYKISNLSKDCCDEIAVTVQHEERNNDPVPIDTLQPYLARQKELANEIHKEKFRQYKLSFNIMIVSGILGLLLLFGSLLYALIFKESLLINIQIISGVIIEFITAIFFYIYKKTDSNLKFIQNNIASLEYINMIIEIKKAVKDKKLSGTLISKIMDKL